MANEGEKEMQYLTIYHTAKIEHNLNPLNMAKIVLLQFTTVSFPS